ncbi:hypothetical protein AAFF_G00150480 [Aldrovandia affinis]|uniref:Uncharacterized protein n=1 Tax=Aldrovandia affinis TaxID=143900 RepID=A0AAD7W8F5_9TELE|nr:hypothetical protein AAFF_G00150480 [Aldrovandia affinis]
MNGALVRRAGGSVTQRGEARTLTPSLSVGHQRRLLWRSLDGALGPGSGKITDGDLWHAFAYVCAWAVPAERRGPTASPRRKSWNFSGAFSALPPHGSSCACSAPLRLQTGENNGATEVTGAPTRSTTSAAEAHVCSSSALLWRLGRAHLAPPRATVASARWRQQRPAVTRPDPEREDLTSPLAPPKPKQGG